MCAFAAAFEILMMIIANLIGYGIGIKGFEHFASRFLAFEGKIR